MLLFEGNLPLLFPGFFIQGIQCGKFAGAVVDNHSVSVNHR